MVIEERFHSPYYRVSSSLKTGLKSKRYKRYFSDDEGIAECVGAFLQASKFMSILVVCRLIND